MQIKNLKKFKINLRSKYREIRVMMSQNKKEIMDKEIEEKFFSLYKYKKANIVLIYVSKEIEVNTLDIIKKMWLDNKIVGVPKCNGDDKSMDFYIIKSFDDLEKGMFGLLEPSILRCKKITDYSTGLCVVPGFCFDFSGYRLGYGHGYYDRFLSRFNGTTVGFCYSNCTSFKLPHGKYDKCVDILVTDRYIRKIYRIKNKS